jgi:hypothetical protein
MGQRDHNFGETILVRVGTKPELVVTGFVLVNLNK